MKRISMAGLGLLTIWSCTAQSTPWVLPGNGGTFPSTDFVGTTDNNQLVFRTDNLFRIRVNATETYPTLGGFSSVPANGFTLISPDNTFLGNPQLARVFHK
ncbi:MAG: hypothetical protein IPO60_06430 [Flavobacteriales bacterium]|nr:hypothetical protein [Flavobacteriales bacterium]MBK6893626.1 hypothetical protein [Flavobacteriales bacterium]MBK7248662.1 hypothetical protein [Flavobacteriales bacterium]MBK7287558.1 hypothetical protein [Flavobacteriales bacterium]MBK9059106.1 hypothetical protein [Flavobacteriales bacterium]